MGRDAPKIIFADDGGARTWRLLHRGRVRRAWTTARHTPRRRRLLSWRNTLHSQAEVSIVTVSDDVDAMSRVARGLKPFAQEWSGGAAADAALLGAAQRLAARDGVGIMTARVELRCDGARERAAVAGTTRTWRECFGISAIKRDYDALVLPVIAHGDDELRRRYRLCWRRVRRCWRALCDLPIGAYPSYGSLLPPELGWDCCAERCRPEHVVLSGLLFGYHLASSAALLLRLLSGGGAADDDDAADDSRC